MKYNWCPKDQEFSSKICDEPGNNLVPKNIQEAGGSKAPASALGVGCGGSITSAGTDPGHGRGAGGAQKVADLQL